ncbi:MAG: energy-coupling factor transport system ATP-binding protein [Solirubrobacterales bacterium]|nr:energy-coupling factor transport system ATP-binding protein [Solirubrobacterales bacterium]
MDSIVRIDGLSYRYPEGTADSLTDVDLQVEPGEFVVLAGRSGSGKSTLLRAACGLVPHFHGGEIEGEIEVTGLDTRDHGPAELAARVGFVSQDPETQAVSTSVAAEIGLPLELRGASSAARARAVEEVALALAIPHLLSRGTDSLSGGELQRVAIAAALVSRPELILLDEPTSQLDPVSGDELVWLLRRLNEEWGVAIVLCEHRLERCLAAADRVVAMDLGRVAFDGPPREFLTWALRSDPPLVTPSARLFDLAGIKPMPTGVRDARQTLADATAGGGGGGRPRAPWLPLSPSHPGERKRVGASGRSPAPAARPNLTIKNLWVELADADGPKQVLRDVDLELIAGETVAVMGRNGAGKSTLFRTAAGLVDPVRGKIEAEGVALLPQNPGDLLVRERVDEELPGPEGRAALAAVGLEHAATADPRDLSGGERQRLALAIVMAGRGGEADEPPGVLLLDEPTRGMDRSRKEDLAAFARELAARGSAVAIATHDVEFAAAFADRVVLFGEGEVIADGPVSELLSGGWYFATEVARVLGLPGVITAEQGAEALKTRSRVKA